MLHVLQFTCFHIETNSDFGIDLEQYVEEKKYPQVLI